MDEFSIIDFFRQQQTRTFHRPDVKLGSGDDAALLAVPAGQLLAVSVDTLIAGVHFPEDLPPEEIGYKALAVNLSDLAAMGAEPAWFTGALSLPVVDTSWLAAFSKGLFTLAKAFNIELVGGDLTHSDRLSITIQVHGFVPESLALRRSGAQVGDVVYVSGHLGKAAASKFYSRPFPRVALGLALRGKAHAAIDISDGLAADLAHILDASKLGASIYLSQLPLAEEAMHDLNLGLAGGDDYELCFTAPANLMIPGHNIYPIGYIEATPGLRIKQSDGTLYCLEKKGYRHF